MNYELCVSDCGLLLPNISPILFLGKAQISCYFLVLTTDY